LRTAAGQWEILTHGASQIERFAVKVNRSTAAEKSLNLQTLTRISLGDAIVFAQRCAKTNPKSAPEGRLFKV
jgi:hypothetical protein